MIQCFKDKKLDADKHERRNAFVPRINAVLADFHVVLVVNLVTLEVVVELLVYLHICTTPFRVALVILEIIILISTLWRVLWWIVPWWCQSGYARFQQGGFQPQQFGGANYSNVLHRRKKIFWRKSLFSTTRRLKVWTSSAERFRRFWGRGPTWEKKRSSIIC